MIIENKKESVLYLLITFMISLASWGILILLGLPVKENGSTTANILYMVGGMSPGIVALLFPVFMKKDQRGSYYKRYFKFGLPLKWYIVSIVSVCMMVGISYLFMFIFFQDAAASLKIKPLYLLPLMAIGMIMGGGFEEFGWRGILVHNLRKSNPFFISLGVGLLWMLWHVPLFFIVGTGQYQTSFLPFGILVIAISFVTTILYTKTNSVIPCLISHALLNSFDGLGIYFGQSNLSAAVAYSTLLLVTGIIAFFVIRKMKPAPI